METVRIDLYNPENNCVYTVHVNEKDAQRLETDIQFAQQMLESVQNETNAVDRNENVEPGSEAENDEEKTSWSYNETLSLIRAYDSYKENFNSAKRRKSVWNDISNELLSNKFTKSAAKCELKWRNLLRTYKNVKDIKKKTGRGASRFQFFDAIDEIIGDKPAVSCNHTFSTTVQSNLPKTAESEVPTYAEASASQSTSMETTNKKEINKHNKTEIHTSVGTGSSKCKSTESSDIKRKRFNELKKKNEELIEVKIAYFKDKRDKLAARERREEKKIELKQSMLDVEWKRLALLEKYLNREEKPKKT